MTIPPTFSSDDLAAIEAARQVRIETRRGPEAPLHRTTIWIMVDGGEVFVRSVRGGRGRWYRELMATGSGALQVGRLLLPIRAFDASDPSGIERCSRALERKYAGDPSLSSMLRPDTLPTTLRLVPDEETPEQVEGRGAPSNAVT